MKFNIPYRDKKVEAAIAYIALEHKKKTRAYVCLTALFKYLAFFDFKSLEETGEPALGLQYRAMERGPVPIEIYNENKYKKSEYYKFDDRKFSKNGKTSIAYNIIPITSKTKGYLDYLSEYDIELLNRLIFFYAQSWVTASIMSDTSHSKKDGIKAWIKAWNREPNSLINMSETFDSINIKDINKNLSHSEEHFLMYQRLHA